MNKLNVNPVLYIIYNIIFQKAMSRIQRLAFVVVAQNGISPNITEKKVEY